MAFWWVSQNKTYQHEAAGGYLWSPKASSAGGRIAAYDFMTEINPGDIVFCFAGREIRAVGIAESTAYEAPKPQVFGRAGDTWPDIGWKVDLFYNYLDAAVTPANHMHLLEPLLPRKYSPIRADGTGNQQYLFPIPDDMARALLGLCGQPELPSLGELRPQFDSMFVAQAEKDIVSAPNISDTEKAQLVLARRGQGKFRNHVRALEKKCRVTGVGEQKLLIASHIKPWKISSNEERLDGNNGLLLSPHVDKLFDGYWISFEKNGRLIVSRQLDPEVLTMWRIDPDGNYGKFTSSQEYFLDFHREELKSQNVIT